ncbi:YraN family protein [Nakamurella endophytica]|uniref:UPF0102 protein GCM10011594_07620 n=1 Tax=Nakamurella endophytica TaxID=1748367 RepID=A0A917SMW8_9ACTN|nr:YraN family protein [Nakamurella endophytica]GGL90451.1 UPF0102 protein [Nakamurella endophytica]
MTATTDELGRRGEDLAVGFLERQGLVVISRNWRCREGEIDVVATDGIDQVVFCEVKTRSGTGFGTPAESVTPDKRRRLRRLAQLYLSQHVDRWVRVRFDVVAVLCRPGVPPTVEHVRAAF